MKEKIIKIVVVLLIIGIMIAPILSNVLVVIPSIKYDELSEKLTSTQNYGYAMVYVASKKDSGTKNMMKSIREIDKSFSTEFTSYYLDYDKLSDDEKIDIFSDSLETTAYIFMVNSEVMATIYGEKDEDVLNSYITMYSDNGVSPNLVNYKTVETAQEYKKLVKSKTDVTMAVFGRNSCSWCNLFKVVYNQVALDENVDIYYFDSDSFDSEEYDKIMDMGLKIPASCSSTGEEVDLQPGFGTPLTLFTKNGKVIDCISGYLNKSSLITKLQTVGMLDAE